MTSRHDVITGNPVMSTSHHLQPTCRVTVPLGSRGLAVRHVGAADVSPKETAWHRSAFRVVGRTARNTFTDLSSISSVTSSQSASALDVFSQCKYCFCFVQVLINQPFSLLLISFGLIKPRLLCAMAMSFRLFVRLFVFLFVCLSPVKFVKSLAIRGSTWRRAGGIIVSIPIHLSVPRWTHCI